MIEPNTTLAITLSVVNCDINFDLPTLTQEKTIKKVAFANENRITFLLFIRNSSELCNLRNKLILFHFKLNLASKVKTDI